VGDQELGTMASIKRAAALREHVLPETVESLMSLYDGEIAANDAAFGELVQELRRRGLYESSLIIVLSDHGEEFHDHGTWTHGKTLHTEMLDVPLIVKLPGCAAGRRVEHIVQHIDLLPTVAELAGGEVPPVVQGQSLVPMLHAGTADGWRDVAVAQAHLGSRAKVSYLEPSWKLIVTRSGEHEAFPVLYDRRADRAERDNVAAEHGDVAAFLAAQLRREEAGAAAALERQQLDTEIQPELREHLRALGYLGSD
jgi:arylsulfatase A-like enzyme